MGYEAVIQFMGLLLGTNLSLPPFITYQGRAYFIPVLSFVYTQTQTHSHAHIYSLFLFMFRLAKRWVSAHLFSNSLSEEAIELLVAHLFLKPFPFRPPSSRITGFLRFSFFHSDMQHIRHTFNATSYRFCIACDVPCMIRW